MKNKIIISVITIVLLALNFLLMYLFNKQSSFFINLGILAVAFIFYRLFMFLIQKLLVSFKVLIYKPDNFSYYGDQKEIREEVNIEYKMQQDRVFSGWLYNIVFIILMTIICKTLNNEGIISSILVALLVSIPSLVLVPRMNKLSGYENFDNTTVTEYKPYQYNENKDKKSNDFRFPSYNTNVSDIKYATKGNFDNTIYRNKDGSVNDEIAFSKQGNFGETIYYDKNGCVKGTSRKDNFGNDIFYTK